jgi:hypothetical protein
MSGISLAETLSGLLEAVDSAATGSISVDEATFSVPVEVRLRQTATGLAIEAAPPGSIWRSGVMLPVNRLRFAAAAMDWSTEMPADEPDAA